jgi:hypothetical protein
VVELPWVSVTVVEVVALTAKSGAGDVLIV